MKSWLFQLLCAAVLFGPQIHAQEPVQTATDSAIPAELSQLKLQYTLRALASARTLSEQFIKALTNIEKEASENSDYEQALIAQKHRQELTQLYSQTLESAALSNTIVLKASEARLNGSVSYDKSEGALVNWKTVGSMATWDVLRLTPGRYDVSVYYGVAGLGDIPTRLNFSTPIPNLATGGDFEVYEDSSLLTATMNRHPASVSSTGGWSAWATVKLPPLDLQRTTARLSLKVTRVNGTGGVMHLKEIRLTPAKVEGSTLFPASAGGSEEFNATQESYLLRLKALITPVINDYTTQLTALLQQATTAKDKDLIEDLQAEIARSNKMLDSTPARISHTLTARVTLRGEGTEEWNNALYVPDASNTTDQFIVSHNGLNVPVRLLGVTCAPLAASDGQDLKMYSDYFAINPDDAMVIAGQARDFTATFLLGKPLQIISNGTKDKDGRLLVTVLLKDVGDFAGVLVDYGLVAINTPPPKSRRGEEALFAALKERETAAKARPVKIGAWGLTAETNRETP